VVSDASPASQGAAALDDEEFPNPTLTFASMETDMFRLRQMARPTRHAALGLLLALAAGSAQAAQVDYFLKIDGIDGEASAAASFDIRPLGGEATIGLLLPAVQSTKDSAPLPDFALLACDGTMLPELRIDVLGPGGRPSLRYKLKDVLVTSYGMRSGDAGVVQEMGLRFGELEWTIVESGETFGVNCASGRCVCTR
jgi:hypothetical protein